MLKQKIVEVLKDKKVLLLKNDDNSFLNKMFIDLKKYSNGVNILKINEMQEYYNLFNDIHTCLTRMVNVSNLINSDTFKNYLMDSKIVFNIELKKTIEQYDYIMLDNFTLVGFIPEIKQINKQVIFNFGVDYSAWFMYLKNRDCLIEFEDLITQCDILLQNNLRNNLSFMCKDTAMLYEYVNLQSDIVRPLCKDDFAEFFHLKKDFFGKELDLKSKQVFIPISVLSESYFDETLQCLDAMESHIEYNFIFYDTDVDIKYRQVDNENFNVCLNKIKDKENYFYYKNLNDLQINFLQRIAKFIFLPNINNFNSLYVLENGAKSKVIVAANAWGNKKVIENDVDGIIYNSVDLNDMALDLYGTMMHFRDAELAAKFTKLGQKLQEKVVKMFSQEIGLYNNLKQIFKKVV
jgi:hypothetical protein